MNRNGQTTVEFAVVAMLLFILVFAIIDFAVMFYVHLTMQHAVREGARYAITGQAGSNGDRRAGLIAKIKEYSNGLYDKNANAKKDPTVNLVAPEKATYANYSGTPVPDTGKPDQIISVSLTYSWPVLTPVLRPVFNNGKYTFTVHATMKNEPWGLRPLTVMQP